MVPKPVSYLCRELSGSAKSSLRIHTGSLDWLQSFEKLSKPVGKLSRFWGVYSVIIKILLNFNKNRLMFREITKISSKNFAKSRKFRPNFDFVFRENFAKLEENFAKHEIKISRNFRKITKTKIFMTTLHEVLTTSGYGPGIQKT